MRKYPVIIQDEEMSCGAYCILMLLKYYGYNEEIQEIKRKSRLNQNGITIKGMIECLKEYQIEAKSYQASIEDIHKQVILPCILHMVVNDVGHYVVLYEIKDDEYIIGDPAKGLVSMYKEELEEVYSHVMIAIIHVGRVPATSYRTYISFIKETFETYKNTMFYLISRGFLIALFMYIGSYFYQFFIDYIHKETHYFYMIVISLTYGFTQIIHILISHKKNQVIIELNQSMNEDIIFESSMNMMSLPQTFYYQDKGSILGQLLSFYELGEMNIELFSRLFLEFTIIIFLTIGMLLIHPVMLIIVMMMFLFIVVMSYRYIELGQKIHQQYLESTYAYQHHLLELIENQFLIKRFLLKQKTRERSYHLFLDHNLLFEKEASTMNHLEHYIQYIIYIFQMIVMIIGLYFYKQNQLSLGQVLMFFMLMSYSIEPLSQLIDLMMKYNKTSLLFDKYKTFQSMHHDEGEVINKRIELIRLDNVGYSYGYSKPLFEHLDLTIDQHILISGSTGCGKSTLLKLLMGYDEQYIGDIYFNQSELKDIKKDSLYEHVGYLNETPTFLHMSLYDNFLCDDEEKVMNILKALNQEHIMNMFHVLLNEDGSPLSLGQRQVVALVRLLCREYDVYIFDESFSHMDSQLYKDVYKYLLSHDENKIYIFVDHAMKKPRKGWLIKVLDK